MKIGIDSYCYHRFWGDVATGQKPTSVKHDLAWFLKRANELKVDGVAVEPPLIARFDSSYLSEVKGMLDEYKLDRVYAWGHPDGLEGGRSEKAFADMMKSIEYAAAIGAKVACPDRQVIDIDGDGSFLMNVQELATAKIGKIAAKAMILNNQHLGMVVQWEDRFYDSVRGNTILGDESNIGSPDKPDALYPDFVQIAAGFGVKGRRVIKKKELRAAIQEMLDHDGPYVLDVVVPYTEHVLPMIPGGRTVKEMILK
jgi:hypothetical protein